jgi:hypothetical protein
MRKVGRHFTHVPQSFYIYPSEQGWMDIISVVGLLCMRVKRPTEEDLRKLRKVLGYLKGTNDWMMKM